jgi:hypothetical protein
MKITKSFLRKLIMEELTYSLKEADAKQFKIGDKVIIDGKKAIGTIVALGTNDDYQGLFPELKFPLVKIRGSLTRVDPARMKLNVNIPEIKEAKQFTPDIRHITGGPLQPASKPEFIGQPEDKDYYVYKFGYMFGNNQPTTQHNFYGVFWKSEIDDTSKNWVEPIMKYMIESFGEEKAKELSMGYPKNVAPPQRRVHDADWRKEKTYGGG